MQLLKGFLTVLLLSVFIFSIPSLGVDVKENLYRWALKYKSSGNYITALELFTFLGNYKQSPFFRRELIEFFKPLKVRLKGEPVIRVAYAKNFKKVQIKCQNRIWFAKFEKNRYLFRGKKYNTLTFQSSGGKCYLFVDYVLKTKLPKGVKVKLTTYKGSLLILELPLELYIKGVLPGEIYTNWPMEALKAQAVASRTYALFNLIKAREAGRPFDVGATVSYQVFAGFNRNFDRVERAVDATKGEVVTYNGGVIYAMFHSNAGGCTHSFKELFGYPLTYLSSVREPCDVANLKWTTWNIHLSKWRVKSFLKKVGVEVYSIRDLKIVRNRCGRGRVAVFETDKGTIKLPLSFFVRLNLHLPSDWFFVLTKSGRKFLLAGRGFGHGLGMSQWGAYCLSLKGWDYKKILKLYYKGTKIERLY